MNEFWMNGKIVIMISMGLVTFQKMVMHVEKLDIMTFILRSIASVTGEVGRWIVGIRLAAGGI